MEHLENDYMQINMENQSEILGLPLFPPNQDIQTLRILTLDNNKALEPFT